MNPAYEALLRELRRARRFLVWRAVERAGFAATFWLLALAGIALLVSLVGSLHRSEYATLRASLLVGTCALIVFALFRILRARAGLADAAIEASHLIGEKDDALLTALELGREGAQRSPAQLEAGYSDALRQSAVRSAAERAANLPLGLLRLWSGRRGWLRRLGLAAVALLAVAALGGGRTVKTVRHIADPETAPVAPIQIRVEPGMTEVEGGASVPIRAFVSGSARKARLLTNERAAPADRPWREIILEAGGEGARPRAGERAYATVLPNLKEDLAYQIRVADQASPVFLLSVRDLPRATGYRVRYEYPAYCGLTAEEANAITGDLAGPRGTRARVDLLLNRSVRSATIEFAGGSGGSGGSGRIEGKIGERMARFQISLRSDARYWIRLVDPRGRKVDLGPFDVKAIPDRPPNVTILSPGPVEDVTRDLMAEIVAGATDDYGVRKILLKYRVRDEAERVETLHEEHGVARELSVRYTWSLAAMNLLPGEEIEYSVGAVDGNQVDGPQTAWSDTRTLRFPSAAEILASVEKQQDESVATLEDAIRNAQSLKEKAEELARDMGRARDLPWEKRQDIQKTLEGQEALREQIDKVAEKLSQDAEKLSQSRALNAELVQKLNELHELLNQLKDQSILRAMQKVQEALNRMSPQELEQAMKNMKLSQEDVIRNLERTIELLKQAKMEEKLEAAAERASEMARRQLALNDSLSRAQQPEKTKDLASGEKGIEKLSQEQRAAIDSLMADLRKMDREASDEAEKQRNAMSEIYPIFEKSIDEMERGEKQRAQESTEDLEKRLEEARQRMSKLKQDFSLRKKNDVGRKMDAAIQDLLEIADEQKKMLDDERSNSGKRAEAQQGLTETTESAANRIGEMAKQTLFITPDILQAVGRALTNQKNAVGRYSMEDMLGGLSAGKEAAISLNQGATALLRARDSMQASKSSTGMQEAMEQLQSLAGDQEQLNGESMSMMPGGEGKGGQRGRMTPDQEGALSRMAAEQEAIRQGLQQAMQKLGQGGGTLGRLSDTAQDMEKVVQELKNGRLEQQTVDRQQRILSRLLDAPRSVEKRDYSRRRTSRPGVDVVRSSPGALSPDLLQARPSLAALLARGGRDPVSPRYRAVVDQYFEALLKGKSR